MSIGGSVTLFTGGGPNLGLFELIDGGVIQDFRLSISSVGTISWTPTAPDFGFGLLVGKATGAARLENIRLFLNSGFNVPVPNGSFGTVVGVLDGTSKLIDAKVASFHATTASPTIINGSAGVAGLLVGFVRSGAEVQRSSVLGYIQLESSTNTAYLGGAIGYLEGRAEGVQVGNTIGLRSTAASLSNANLGGLVSKAFNNAILRFSSTGLVPDFANTPDSGAGLGGFVGRCEGTSTLQGLWSTNNVAPTTVPTNTGSVIGHSAVTCSALQIRHQSWSSGVFGGVAPSTINGVEAWTAAVDPSRWAGLESAARLAGFKMHGRPGSSVNNYPTLLSDDVVMGTSVTDSDVRGPLGSDRFRLNIPADPSPVPDRNAILFPALATAIDTPVDYPALRYAFSFRIDSMNPSAALNNMSFAIGICRGGRSRLNITTPTVVSQTINSAGEVLLCGTLATDDFVGIAKSAPDTSFGARLDGAPFANGTAISESQIVNRNVTMLVDMPARQISFLSDGQVFADISLPTAAQFTPIVAFGRHGPGGQLGISRNWGWEQSTQVWVADDYDDAFSPGFLGFWGGP